MTELRFTVPGVAQTKGSARAYTVPRRRADGTSYVGVRVDNDNPKAKLWTAEARWLAKLAIGDDIFAPGAVALEVWFYLPRPKEYLTKRHAARDIAHVRKPDLDKMLRLVKDTLTSVVWRDDSMVVDVEAHKRYVAAGELPHVDIAVRAIATPRVQVETSPTPSLFGGAGVRVCGS